MFKYSLVQTLIRTIIQITEPLWLRDGWFSDGDIPRRVICRIKLRATPQRIQVEVATKHGRQRLLDLSVQAGRRRPAFGEAEASDEGVSYNRNAHGTLFIRY